MIPMKVSLQVLTFYCSPFQYQPRAAQQPYANYRPASPYPTPFIQGSPGNCHFNETTVIRRVRIRTWNKFKVSQHSRQKALVSVEVALTCCEAVDLYLERRIFTFPSSLTLRSNNIANVISCLQPFTSNNSSSPTSPSKRPSRISSRRLPNRRRSQCPWPPLRCRAWVCHRLARRVKVLALRGGQGRAPFASSTRTPTGTCSPARMCPPWPPPLRPPRRPRRRGLLDPRRQRPQSLRLPWPRTLRRNPPQKPSPKRPHRPLPRRKRRVSRLFRRQLKWRLPRRATPPNKRTRLSSQSRCRLRRRPKKTAKCPLPVNRA